MLIMEYQEILIECELRYTEPDIILLYEVGNPKERTLKLMNYNTISNALDLHSGVAILVKKDTQF